MFARANFDYGNARLRVRKGALLDRSAYDRLFELDLDGILEMLAGALNVKEAKEPGSEATGPQAFHQAVSQRFARALEEMRGFYTGPARALVDLLLSKWDLQNLITLLRARAAGVTGQDMLGGIVEIGRIDGHTIAETLAKSGPDDTLQMLAKRLAPGPRWARACYIMVARGDNLAALEHAAVSEHYAGATAAVAALGAAGQPLRRALERDIDCRNILIALRLNGTPGRPPAPSPAFIAGGSVATPHLRAAVDADAREAPSVVSHVLKEPRMQDALRSWSVPDGLVQLQERLETACMRSALDLFHCGDPLGIDIPIAFVTAQEAEARNLRLVGERSASGWDRATLADRLLVADERSR